MHSLLVKVSPLVVVVYKDPISSTLIKVLIAGFRFFIVMAVVLTVSHHDSLSCPYLVQISIVLELIEDGLKISLDFM